MKCAITSERKFMQAAYCGNTEQKDRVVVARLTYCFPFGVPTRSVNKESKYIWLSVSGSKVEVTSRSHKELDLKCVITD